MTNPKDLLAHFAEKKSIESTTAKLQADAMSRIDTAALLGLQVHQVEYFTPLLPPSALIQIPNKLRTYYSRAFFTHVLSTPLESRHSVFPWHPSPAKSPKLTHLPPLTHLKLSSLTPLVTQSIFSYSPLSNDASYLLTPIHHEPRVVDELLSVTHPVVAIFNKMVEIEPLIVDYTERDREDWVGESLEEPLIVTLSKAIEFVLSRTEPEETLLYLVRGLVANEFSGTIHPAEMALNELLMLNFTMAFFRRKRFEEYFPYASIEPQMAFMDATGDSRGKAEVFSEWVGAFETLNNTLWDKLRFGGTSAHDAMRGIRKAFPESYAIIATGFNRFPPEGFDSTVLDASGDSEGVQSTTPSA